MLSLRWDMNWNPANVVVKEMHSVPIESWIWVHALYASAGGFVLETPGFPKFPINSRRYTTTCVSTTGSPPLPWPRPASGTVARRVHPC